MGDDGTGQGSLEQSTGHPLTTWTRWALDRFSHARGRSDSAPPVFYEFDHAQALLHARQLGTGRGPNGQVIRQEWNVALNEQALEHHGPNELRVAGGCLVVASQSPTSSLLMDLVAAGTTSLVGYDSDVGRALDGWLAEAKRGRYGLPPDVRLIGPRLGRDRAVAKLVSADRLEQFDIEEWHRRSLATRGSQPSALVLIVHHLAARDHDELNALSQRAASDPALGLVVVGPNALADVVVVAGSSSATNAIYESFDLADVRRSYAGNGSVVINVLGRVEIDNAEGEFSHRPKLTELVVYLAMHPSGATTPTWSSALWPNRSVPPQTVANRLSETRRALGIAQDGKPRLRRDGERHLIADFRTDWDEFRQLTGPDSSTDAWRRALELVRGRPFEGLHRDEWTVIEGIASEIEQRVADCALAYGEQSLSDGRAEDAVWAAQAGLRAYPWEERLHRLLMRAADATGNRAGIEHILRHLALVMEIDGNPLDGVHPETAALYHRLTTSTTAAHAIASAR